MVDELKAHGIILHNHICGNTIPIIDDFVATGAQVLEIDHKTDMPQSQGRRPGQDLLPGEHRHRRARARHARRGRGGLPRGD